MKIETKYNIGDKVWIVYEANTQYGLSGEVSVYDAEIESITVDSEGLYYNIQYCNHKENEIIPYEDKEALVAKIQEVMNAIHKREEEDE